MLTSVFIYETDMREAECIEALHHLHRPLYSGFLFQTGRTVKITRNSSNSPSTFEVSIQRLVNHRFAYTTARATGELTSVRRSVVVSGKIALDRKYYLQFIFGFTIFLLLFFSIGSWFGHLRLLFLLLPLIEIIRIYRDRNQLADAIQGAVTQPKHKHS